MEARVRGDEEEGLAQGSTGSLASSSGAHTIPSASTAPRTGGLAAFLFGSRPKAATTGSETTPLLSNSEHDVKPAQSAGQDQAPIPATLASTAVATSPTSGPSNSKQDLAWPWARYVVATLLLNNLLYMLTDSTATAHTPRCCRFCLGEEGEDPELGSLFTPCLCRDTVHQVCLRRWRATNTVAFYSCNVCKWQYQFQRLSPWRRLSIHLMIPLWPICGLLALSFALGFIPVFGPAGSDIGLHLLNGLAAVGLLYLTIIVTVFNVQFCRLTIMAARSAAASVGMETLPLAMQVQLFGYVVARCLLVGLFFGFCILYFFPYSGFLGFVAMVLASPPGIREVGNRIIRRLEFEQPVSEVTPEMAAQAAADRAAEAARAAEASRQQQEHEARASQRSSSESELPSPVPVIVVSQEGGSHAPPNQGARQADGGTCAVEVPVATHSVNAAHDGVQQGAALVFR